MSRAVVIVQARMGSTRLPGKVLAEVEGEPMLARQLRRLRACRSVDEVVVATTGLREDDDIARLCAWLGTAVFRGPSEDVLGRYLAAAERHRATRVVRITADCPLIDPTLVDLVVAGLTEAVDLSTNVAPRTFPRGLDVEAVHLAGLKRLAALAASDADREHVTALAYRRPDQFRIHSVVAARGDDSDLRWTVDEPADLALVRALHRELLVHGEMPGYRAIANYVRARPHLADWNRSVEQRRAA